MKGEGKYCEEAYMDGWTGFYISIFDNVFFYKILATEFLAADLHLQFCYSLLLAVRISELKEDCRQLERSVARIEIKNPVNSHPPDHT